MLAGEGHAYLKSVMWWTGMLMSKFSSVSCFRKKKDFDEVMAPERIFRHETNIPTGSNRLQEIMFQLLIN